MPTGWGKRIEVAILTYASTHGRTTLERWGELVAARESRDKSYSKGAVGDWIAERNEPTLATFDAMAALVGADPWWFPWGTGRAPGSAAVPKARAKRKPSRVAIEAEVETVVAPRGKKQPTRVAVGNGKKGR